jgi:geranylgeranyl diphosphate synthase type I
VKVAPMEHPTLRSTDFFEAFEPPAPLRIARDRRTTRHAQAVAPPELDAALIARFERALVETVTGLLEPGDSPVAEHVAWHFGIGCDDGAPRGKRLRPRMLLHVALDEGGSFESALDAALAVELLHNYSLVHDDIEDGDTSRRGRQTVWARYGLSHGINAGDAICAVSYLTLLRNSGCSPPERLMATARVLQRANLAMCAGQAHDLDFETAAEVSLETYVAMIDGKTAALFGAACELGALCAGCDPIRTAAYAELGRAYGRAFQIRDDVLGVSSDIARRKWSFPIAWALAGPPSAARSTIATRYARSSPLDRQDVDAIAEALDALGARRAAETAALEHFGEASRLAQRYRLDRAGTVRALFALDHSSKAIA